MHMGSAEPVSLWRVAPVAPFPAIDCFPSFGSERVRAGSMSLPWTLASLRSRLSLGASGQCCE
jgi:hypothetical protein